METDTHLLSYLPLPHCCIYTRSHNILYTQSTTMPAYTMLYHSHVCGIISPGSRLYMKLILYALGLHMYMQKIATYTCAENLHSFSELFYQSSIYRDCHQIYQGITSQMNTIIFVIKKHIFLKYGICNWTLWVSNKKEFTIIYFLQ